MNKIIKYFFILLCIFIGINKVHADSADCQGALNGYNNKIAVGEEFVYDVGTMGAASNSSINGIHYVIEYDADKLEVVNVNNNAASSYNGWKISSKNNTNTGLRVNQVIIDASTSDKSKMYSSIVVDKFVKVANIKFRVKKTDDNSTSIDLIKDKSYYMDDIDGYGTDKRICDDDVRTLVNIYKKNDDTTLSSLKLNHGELDPKFSKETTSYEATVDNDISSIQIEGTCNGTNCIVSGIGLKELNVGSNTFVITVTSESGSAKTYNLNIIRKDKEDISLTKLKVKNAKLLPDFSSDIDNYVVIVENDINKLDVDYIASDSKNKVEISGNDNLKVGENEIIVTVKNEDKNIENNYKILAIKKEKPVEVSKFDYKWIIISMLVLIVVVESIIMIIKLRK